MNKPIFSPLCLRLVLGITFLWAGSGKVFTKIDVQGEQAATLANAGVTLPQPAPTPQPVPLTPPADPPAAHPEDTTPPHPNNNTNDDDDRSPIPDRDLLRDRESREVPLAAYTVRPVAFLTQDGSGSNTGADSRPVQATPEPGVSPDRRPDDGSPSQPVYTPADFPEPVKVRGLYGLVLLMHHANNPTGAHEDGTPYRPIWPDAASSGNRLVILAWVAALSELVFGVLCLVGFFTRLGALSFAATMLTAIWLTEIGPAVQAGMTVLGFLPPDRPAFDPAAWRNLLWQFALLMSSLALVALGPGRLSIDHLLFGGMTSTRRDRDDDDDE